MACCRQTGPSIGGLVLILGASLVVARTIGAQGYGLGNLYNLRGIIAIEAPDGGLFVGTSDKNYAIIDKSLEKFGWLAVSVNGNRVALSTINNGTQLETLDLLDKKAQELLTERLQLYTSNLDKIKISISGIKETPYRSNNYHNPGSSGLGWVAKRAYGGPGYNPIKYAAVPTPQPPIFNYFNLALSKLEDKLTGDIYTFNLGYPSEILDVFSEDVIVKQRPGEFSILFRDDRFFSYSRRNLPSRILRFFVRDFLSVFVFKDKTVLAEPISNSFPEEQNLVLTVQDEIKRVAEPLAISKVAVEVIEKKDEAVAAKVEVPEKKEEALVAKAEVAEKKKEDPAAKVDGPIEVLKKAQDGLLEKVGDKVEELKEQLLPAFMEKVKDLTGGPGLKIEGKGPDLKQLLPVLEDKLPVIQG